MGKYKADLVIGILANVVGILNLALGYRFLANYYGWNVGASVPPPLSGSVVVKPAAGLWLAFVIMTVGVTVLVTAWVKMFIAIRQIKQARSNRTSRLSN
jgi:hypothetical protein